MSYRSPQYHRSTVFLLVLALTASTVGLSCTTTPPPDPAASYRERLWAEIGSLPVSMQELLQPEKKPPGTETLLYLKAYDLEPPDAPENSWYIRLGVLREEQGHRRDPSYGRGTGNLPSLPPPLLLDSLPPLGVLVCVPKEGAANPPTSRDNGRDKGESADGFKGTVFLVHGYLDHSGSWAPVIKRILRQGFIVVALDLPGHGFSGGNRGDIEHFSQYGEAVRRVVEWAAKVSPPRPWIAIGHSTGAAALWMELARREEARKSLDENTSGVLSWKAQSPAFDNVLFLAPLVRSAHWRLSMTLVSLTSWAIPYWKSRTAADPLFPIPYFPVHWAEKLQEWEGAVGEYPVIYQKGWILQGTEDDVVDHGYSVPFLRSKLPGFQVRYIEGAGHVPYLATPAGERFVQSMLDVLGIPR
jgi:pimeloyl-ACP methyl ester carboxylesterase